MQKNKHKKINLAIIKFFNKKISQLNQMDQSLNNKNSQKDFYIDAYIQIINITENKFTSTIKQNKQI